MSIIELNKSQMKGVVIDFIDGATEAEFKWLILLAFNRDDRRGYDTMEVLPKLRKQLMSNHCLDPKMIDSEWRGK